MSEHVDCLEAIMSEHVDCLEAPALLPVALQSKRMRKRKGGTNKLKEKGKKKQAKKKGKKQAESKGKKTS